MKKTILYFLLFLVPFFIFGIITIPKDIKPFAKVLYDKNNNLLSARLSADEQWRFESLGDPPQKYITSLISYEDLYFFYHPGINPISLFRSAKTNIKARKIISGGSTITMQTIRLRRGFDKKRNIGNKLLEMYWALCAELIWSKRKILNDYVSRAPFGSNVIGLEAACWRYFDKPGSTISWADAALLAVLPNNPALIHPGKNREILRTKRDRLLHKLFIQNKIDKTTLELSLLEPIPEKPKSLPSMAPHALDFLILSHPNQNIFNSTLDISLQNRLNETSSWNYNSLSTNQIYNLGILIADTKSGAVLAYSGNAPQSKLSIHVDHVQAARSTGSILKPFLFAGTIYRGEILPTTLLDDYPSAINGYQPKNFSLRHHGAIPAHDALVQSLNIPFVLLLQKYGIEQFHSDLKSLGLKDIKYHPGHYGLSLILGGAESSLWDITGAYAYMGRVLTRFEELDHSYNTHDNHPLYLLKENQMQQLSSTNSPPIFSAASIHHTLNTLLEVNRPDELGIINNFSSQMPLSWKTGTSYGFRDAWAIGTNAAYTIGVWVGNSSGEGKSGLLGAKVAAPILFEVTSFLKNNVPTKFDTPWDEMIQIPICKQSGMKPNENCNQIDTIFTCRFNNQSSPCAFHKKILINKSNQLQVYRSCAEQNSIEEKLIFQLPPLAEHYYTQRKAEYEIAPAMDPNCVITNLTVPMTIIQPKANADIYIPIGADGHPGKVVFSLAHRRPETAVHWHLDHEFISTTRTFHEIGIYSEPGKHILSIIDSTGYTLEVSFNLLSK